jgi:hypothetical protein
MERLKAGERLRFERVYREHRDGLVAVALAAVGAFA